MHHEGKNGESKRSYMQAGIREGGMVTEKEKEIEQVSCLSVF